VTTFILIMVCRNR